jgi:protein-S-isoprenylcysteine O-methyltransferase Ste14
MLPATTSNVNFGARLRNLVASSTVVGLASLPVAFAPYYRAQLESSRGPGGFTVSGLEFWVPAALSYMLLLALYYFAERQPRESKSLKFWRVVGRFSRAPVATLRAGLSRDDRLAVLATLLKAFFGPMMAFILFRSVMGCLADGGAFLDSVDLGFTALELFNRYGYWFALQLIILVDVAAFTAGYLIETPRLKNEIRSVDPTLIGWAAALACYWPFSTITGYVLGRQVSDFPQFEDPTAHLVLNVLLLVLMAVYTCASVALGFKASNLTHRGVVTRWPYSWVRHPAYTCKNLSWWIGAVPVVGAAFSIGLFEGISSVASVVGWTMLYVLRALTEEDHLRRVDGDYAAYAARVRYRFIPGIV